MPANTKNIISKYLKFPLSKHEIIKSQLKVFMTMKETYEKLFKIEANSSFLEDIKDTLTAELVTLSKDSQLIKCEELVEENSFDRYILEDCQYLILLELSAGTSTTAKLIKKLQIANLKPVLDPNQPKCLSLYMANEDLSPGTQRAKKVELCFEDIATCKYIKNHIEKCAEKFVAAQVASIMKYIGAEEKENYELEKTKP
eukprot:TRINITY_DN2672_c0_g1_i2.p2 TRINITY_DN2672_c0_g1~~TRINITY_DN2672_c0_g1_i2.p2  ORF type:complete len:200 (+),score=62.88 TRINITY_DN2672_c0_g1_i2:2311-2910(+)